MILEGRRSYFPKYSEEELCLSDPGDVEHCLRDGKNKNKNKLISQLDKPDLTCKAP